MQKLLQVHHAIMPGEETSGEVERGRRAGDHNVRRHTLAPDAGVAPTGGRGLLRGPTAGHGAVPESAGTGGRQPAAPAAGLRPGLPATSQRAPHPARPAAQPEFLLPPAPHAAAGPPARQPAPRPAVPGLTGPGVRIRQARALPLHRPAGRQY